MKRLDYYVAATVGSTMILAVVGLVGILSLFTLLEQLEDMVNEYRLINVVIFVLMSVPRVFYETMPYAALIGCLAGLGMLANNSELVVMRAAGLSTWQITWSTMKPTLLLVIFGLYVGEYVLPDVERVARTDRLKAMSKEQRVTNRYGFWYREGNVFMHFDEINQAGEIRGVSHYYFNTDKQLERSLYAERGVFHDVRPGERYWLLENIQLTDITLEGTRSTKLSSLRWNSGLEPDLLNTESLVQPDQMSIGELYRKIDYMQEQGINSNNYELGYWGKVMQPLATISLVFVAISFIFGPLRESSMGTRVVTGLVVGILFKFLQGLLSPASMVFGFSPMIAILVPILICFGMGLWMLRKAG